jgi:hypothetical protein
MKRSKKNVILILLPITVIIIAVGISLKNARYQICDITADNFRELLATDNSFSLAKISSSMAGPLEIPSGILTENKNIIPNANWRIYKSENSDGGYLVNVTDEIHSLHFAFRFNSEKSDIINLFEFSNANIHDENGIRGGNQLIDNFLHRAEFTYKESRMKRHPDIIIKDFGDDFLIGEVQKLENEAIYSLIFELFKKNKYSFF